MKIFMDSLIIMMFVMVIMGGVVVFTAKNLETGDNHGKVLYQMWNTRTNLLLQ